ncbi:polyphosphate kinase 1 [Vitreoscilla stercoraria]|uniref:Polyphosphate kinase n=1 Tax=Vitreoscilla stercoraria TaxID=61 RepID=A0ABY4EFE6_VITST|nr:polyphosphate kinase 1 [Vitreoscilla stercoraria]UOO93438.1 polyphosphate kinase 1 [Vitreoscilla stercoraria]
MPQAANLLCREMSLLAFNRRVLAQANDERVPLLERLKFLCIVSSNLDEFFEVRMAWLKQQQKINGHLPLPNGELPQQVIHNVIAETRAIVQEQYQMFNQKLVPALQQQGIRFYRRREWSKEQTAWIEQYFHRELKPILTPIGLDPSHPFPRLMNKSLNFAVELDGKDAFGRESGMAIVQAPRILPRVVKLPSHLSEGEDGFVFLSSIMHAHIDTLFSGMEVKGCHQFRVTRDSDLTVDEEDLKNLRTAIQGELRDRQFGEAVRLEITNTCPAHVVDFLLEQFQLSEDAMYVVNGPVNLVRLMAVTDMVDKPELKFNIFRPSIPKKLRQHREKIFETLAERDVLLHHPYQSFQSVVDLVKQAAKDPAVVAIKMTIYRTGNNSDLVKALLQAALLGKQVTVVMELMARFDEETNVNWASQLEQVGAHVVYGVFGYKVHAKMALVIRRENGILKSYAHLGTGNYHQGTSRLYTDLGLLTANEPICQDVNQLFMEITGLGQPSHLNKLFQSPFTLHPMLLDKIEREMAHVQAGGQGHVMAKMNSLVEPSIIQKLYDASQAGVKIDLIVRGMCVLKPGVAGLSDNIRVRSIVGRLLEHSRVFYFGNAGKSEVFISSADWMGRNFFRRIETCVPVLDPQLKQRVIRETLTLALEDNAKAWDMQADGSYIRAYPDSPEKETNLQEILMREFSL